ncbi:hypothetical protein GTA07_22470, partial [Rhodococcus hoagii]|nr:hypothetical protein [Prescottella equi]
RVTPPAREENPPSDAIARPIGAYADDISVSGFAPHTSRVGPHAEQRQLPGCTPTTDATHPVDPHAPARDRTAA